MNESTLTQLKIIVERAVRPVRASTSHKRRVREELLAHVSGVFEEAFAQLGDDRAALQRTQERFGPAADLTGQLQASVPGTDWFTRIVEQIEAVRPGESTLRRAVRYALMMFVVFGAAVLPVFLVRHRLAEWPIIPAAAILAFCFTLLANWMRAALYGPAGRSWVRAVLIGGAAALIIPAATFGLCAAHSGEVGASLLNVAPLMPLAVLLTWIPVVVTAYASEKGIRYRREWDSLQIH